MTPGAVPLTAHVPAQLQWRRPIGLGSQIVSLTEEQRLCLTCPLPDCDPTRRLCPLRIRQRDRGRAERAHALARRQAALAELCT